MQSQANRPEAVSRVDEKNKVKVVKLVHHGDIGVNHQFLMTDGTLRQMTFEEARRHA